MRPPIWENSTLHAIIITNESIIINIIIDCRNAVLFQKRKRWVAATAHTEKSERESGHSSCHSSPIRCIVHLLRHVRTSILRKRRHIQCSCFSYIGVDCLFLVIIKYYPLRKIIFISGCWYTYVCFNSGIWYMFAVAYFQYFIIASNHTLSSFVGLKNQIWKRQSWWTSWHSYTKKRQSWFATFRWSNSNEVGSAVVSLFVLFTVSYIVDGSQPARIQLDSSFSFFSLFSSGNMNNR